MGVEKNDGRQRRGRGDEESRSISQWRTHERAAKIGLEALFRQVQGWRDAFRQDAKRGVLLGQAESSRCLVTFNVQTFGSFDALLQRKTRGSQHV